MSKPKTIKVTPTWSFLAMVACEALKHGGPEAENEGREFVRDMARRLDELNEQAKDKE